MKKWIITFENIWTNKKHTKTAYAETEVDGLVYAMEDNFINNYECVMEEMHSKYPETTVKTVIDFYLKRFDKKVLSIGSEDV